MRTVIILMCTAQLLSPCYSYKSLTKKGEPTTGDIRSKIRLEKMHMLTLKSGQELRLYVTSVDSVKIKGEVHERGSDGKPIKYPYEDTFESLEKNASEISVRKINPY